MSIAAIVLAAGASQRLGELKQLIRLAGESLLDRAVGMCREAGCAPIIVVLGASADTIRSQCKLDGTTVVVNDDWSEGMGSSLRTGVNMLGDDVEGCLIVACDMPSVTPAHLRRLTKIGELTASEYAGRRGVPAYFPASLFAALTQVQGDRGARDLLKQAAAVPLTGGELDIDTPADLRRVRALFD